MDYALLNLNETFYEGHIDLSSTSIVEILFDFL